MTTDVGTSNPAALSSRKNIHQRRLLLMAALLGIVVGILFILVQPLFGMDTLTSRHAALYQQLGGWSAIPALVIAWFAHLTVSVLYGLMSGIVVMTMLQLPLVVLVLYVYKTSKPTGRLPEIAKA